MFRLSHSAVTALAPLLRLMDAEDAHRLAIRALGAGLISTHPERDDPRLAVQAMGLSFANPIGLAAGFDKDAEAVLPLMKLGFGFVEAGTVTRLAQSGNPRPRLFRLAEDRAVINRMGFNNGGLARYCERLAALPARPCPFGANVGINKDGADPERDYPVLVAGVGRYADYVTINVSSPNTPGLRDLQGEVRLRAILRAIAREVPVRPPILVKLAPDLAEEGLASIVEVAIEEGAAGLIIGNTTISPPAGFAQPQRRTGGAGCPARRCSRARRRCWPRLEGWPAGGCTWWDVAVCRRARTPWLRSRRVRASCKSIRPLPMDGPAVISRIKRQLLDALQQEGFANVEQAVGASL